MSDPQWIAWAAGFFEGEGSFSRGGKKGGRGHIIMSVGNTDASMLERFCATVGSGAIYEHRARRSGKRYWNWNAWVQADVDRIVEDFWPYLSDRRRDRYTELAAIRQCERDHATRERICPHCGAPFRPAGSRASVVKWCSVRCRNTGNSRIKRARNA